MLHLEDVLGMKTVMSGKKETRVPVTDFSLSDAEDIKTITYANT
jgi:hypothetical protein